MNNYKFYTPPVIASHLIKLLPKRNYKNIIDICCGSWNLLEAAKNEFGTAEYVGVDIDKKAKVNCFNDAVFICEDGRKFALKEEKKYDLILSNPPFGYLKDDQRIFNRLHIGNIEVLNNKRYENEMIQANLLLAKEGGVLLFILPATFFEGDSYLTIRKELCKKYTVHSIIKLPIETFGSKKINTLALILINSGKQRKETQLKKIICNDGVWKIIHLKNISLQCMIQGNWMSSPRKTSYLNNVKIFRGNISSEQMSMNGVKVFHSSSVFIDNKWQPSIRFCDDEKIIKNAKKVEIGDIIINRIGRYAGYWCISQDEAFVSDNLIVIKALNRQEIYNALLKKTTDGMLNVETRGVATKYITLRDILELL